MKKPTEHEFAVAKSPRPKRTFEFASWRAAKLKVARYVGMIRANAARRLARAKKEAVS